VLVFSSPAELSLPGRCLRDQDDITHYHIANANFERIFSTFGNRIRFEFEFLFSVLEFEFGEFSRHFQNSNSPNIREFDYEFEFGEFSPPLVVMTLSKHSS
jgi:hypothetical protein